ncbi:hypothetical protein E2C01_056947 [Portunus trituberculatus]|uniref:Uncharacterized protein n=1 Tax=Portunus trituberculatus TaxID=210409 RepID=A0A5B7H0I1_PORTR|nr:hypothetical protein [Portunus trituberculatus]
MTRLTHSTLRSEHDNTPRIGREGACVRNSDIQAVGTPPLAPQYHTRLPKPYYLDAVRATPTPGPAFRGMKAEGQCAGRGESYPIRQYREHHKTTSLAAAIFEEEAKSEGEEASMLAILPCSAHLTACLTCERNENQDYCWQEYSRTLRPTSLTYTEAPRLLSLCYRPHTLTNSARMLPHN